MASRQKLVDMCDRWINFLSENTSLHGVSWYPKIENRFFKCLICLFTALVIFGLPWILILQMIEYPFGLYIHEVLRGIIFSCQFCHKEETFFSLA